MSGRGFSQSALAAAARRELQVASPVVAAVALSAGILFNGFDNAFGGAGSCLTMALLLLVLLVAKPPRVSQWFTMLPVIAITGLAALWAALPLVTRSLAGLSVPPPLVPDLMGSEFLELFADVAALASGFLIARKRARIGETIHWLVLIGAALLLFGLGLRQAGADSGFGLWTPNPNDRFGGTIGNANVEACFAAIIAVLAYGQALVAMRVLRARGATLTLFVRIAFYWQAVLLGVGACVTTASRTTVVLILVALGVLTVRRFWGRANIVRAALPVGIGLAIVVILLFTQYSDLLFERFAGMRGGDSSRIEMWRQYLPLAERSPWFGYGLGSFPVANTRALTDPVTAQHLWAVNSAHNFFLQLWLQAGIPYLALILLAIGVVAAGVVRNLRRDRGDLQSSSLILAILIVFGSSMVDIALDVPAMVAITTFLGGLLWGAAPRVKAARRSKTAAVAGLELSEADPDDDD